MRDNNGTSREECFDPKTGVTHHHAQLGLPDKGRAIKGIFFCYVVRIGSRCVGLAHCCGQDGYSAQVT